MEHLNTVRDVDRADFTMPAAADYNLGDYVQEISKYDTLSAEEERATAKLAKEGSIDAKQLLIKSNLKLVVNMAKKMLHSGNLPITDLIQEGNIGLMIAAEKFNYKLGYRFSTYAAWWIKQSMFKAISEQSRPIKIPVYVQETMSKFTKIKTEMEQNGNFEVKNSDVAERMNLDAEKINLYLNAFGRMLSLDGEFESSGKNEVCLSEIIEDKSASAQKNAEAKALAEDIREMLGSLKERESSVIKMRFGLENEQRQTLEEIGNIFGVTKECIRQTETRALRKLKDCEKSAGLYSAYIV